MKLKKLILFASFLGTTDGWLVNGSRLVGRHQVILGSAGREPAGVERVFTEAKKMRKSQLHRLASKAKSSRRLPLFRTRGKLRKREKALEGQASTYEEDFLKIKEHISIAKTGWEFEGDKELDSLVAMKLMLQDDFQKLENETVLLSGGRTVSPVEHFQDVYGDIRLLRFLRKDRKRDPVSAAMAYRGFLQWRNENGIDHIRAEVEDRAFDVPPTLQFVAELIPCDFDVDEDPPFTVTLHLGNWSTVVLSRRIRKQEITISDFLLYWIYIFESVHKRLNSESLQQRRMVFIDSTSDLKGFSMQQLSPAFISSILRPWVRQLQANYPETAKRIDVTNSPHVVSLLWKLVVPLLSPGTVAKIRIR